MTIKSCFGISSACNDHKHVLFFDFDCTHTDHNYKMIVNELKETLEKHHLTAVHVIKSTNGYNAFCLDKLPLQAVKEVLEPLNMIDQDFVKYGFKRGYYTLRMDHDKVLIYSLFKPRLARKQHKQSNAHRIFFNNTLNARIKKDLSFDNFTSFIIIHYESNKNGLVLNEI